MVKSTGRLATENHRSKRNQQQVIHDSRLCPCTAPTRGLLKRLIRAFQTSHIQGLECTGTHLSVDRAHSMHVSNAEIQCRCVPGVMSQVGNSRSGLCIGGSIKYGSSMQRPSARIQPRRLAIEVYCQNRGRKIIIDIKNKQHSIPLNQNHFGSKTRLVLKFHWLQHLN